MKKYLFCILAMVLVLCSCATNKPAESVGKPETDVSSTQTQQKDDNLSSNTVTAKPEQTTDSSVESTVTDSKPQQTPPASVEKPTSQPSVEKPASKPSSPQTPSEEKVYGSTIATPWKVKFYQGGKYGVSTNEKLNLAVAKCVEAWYKDYENNTLPLTKTAVTEEMIAKIKYNETVVEICFYYNQEINFLDKIKLENTYKLLIPLTGDYAYYVFRGNSEYTYQNGLHHVKGAGGLEKYFEHVTLDKEANNWQSTVIAPSKVTFYKDGMQTESTDKKLNLKIIKHIESWFIGDRIGDMWDLAATTTLIDENKRNETAIELQFDGEINFYGTYIGDNALFVPITGEYAYFVFNNDLKNPYYWGGPRQGGTGLEQFFDGIKFTPLTEEQKRWRSTTQTPREIQFYENGKLIGESEDFRNYPFNKKIGLHIESWFYKKENIETVTVSNTPLESAWSKGNYIKLWYDDAPSFYGKEIFDKNSKYLIIPLTGDYAYHIFEGTYDKMSNTAIVANGHDLEQFFDEFKSKK